MSNEALLQNAKHVLSENKLEGVRKEIENARYHFGLITDKNVFLNNLLWMWPPEEWWAYTQFADKTGKVYERIAPRDQSHSLGSVAERIQKNYTGDTPEKLLTTLYQESDWFGRHLSFSTLFDPKLLSPLWVRSVREHEQGSCGESGWKDKLYIEDGNHRALVYALRILCEAEKFIPVPVLWCKSWNQILPWSEGPDTADSDCPPPQLGQYFGRSTVNEYLSCFFNN